MVPKSVRNVHAHMQLLGTLCSCKKNMRNNIIRNGGKRLIGVICECAENLLLGNVKLQPHEIDKLRKHKAKLRKLIKKSSLESKKKILVQNGGFLQILIPAAITAISNIISAAISK